MTPLPVSVADLRCHKCGSYSVVLVAPGSQQSAAEIGIIVDTGQPIRATCLKCWPMLQGYQQSLWSDTELKEQPTP